MAMPKKDGKEEEVFEQPNLNPLRRILRHASFTEEQCGYLKSIRQKGYEILGQIGRGGYGVVYKARSIHSPEKQFAIKVNYDIVCRSTIFLEAGFYHLLKRKRGMSRLTNVFAIDDVNHIVLEYFQHHSVPEIFYRLNTLDGIRHYMIQLLKGIKTLKSMGIYHRDIKPHNFLYNIDKKKGVIVDYGMAEVDVNFIEHVVKKKVKEAKKKQGEVEEDSIQMINAREELCLYKRLEEGNRDNGTLKIGTESYCALESLLRLPSQGHQCEIWSAGVILLQFLTSRSHFFTELRIENGEDDIKYLSIFVMQLAQLFGPKELEEFANRFQFSLTLPEGVCRGDIRRLISQHYLTDRDILLAYDLLSKMLQLYPKARISVEDAFMHPFFDNVRKQHIQSQSEHSWVNRMLEKRFRDAIQKGPDFLKKQEEKIIIDGLSQDNDAKFIKWPDLEPILPVIIPPVKNNNENEDSLQALKKDIPNIPKKIERPAQKVITDPPLQKKQPVEQPKKVIPQQKIEVASKVVRLRMIIQEDIQKRERIVVDGDEEQYYLHKKKKKIRKQKRLLKKRAEQHKQHQQQKQAEWRGFVKINTERMKEKPGSPPQSPQKKQKAAEKRQTKIIVGTPEMKKEIAHKNVQQDEAQAERRRRQRTNQAIFRLLQEQIEKMKKNTNKDQQ